MALIQEVEIPFLQHEEQAVAPGTPPAGMLYIYAKTDGNIYVKNSAGTETQVSGVAAPAESDRGISGWIEGDLAVEADVGKYVAPLALTVKEVLCVVGTAPTGADVIVDINKNGTTLFTTQGNRPTIAAGTTSDTSVAPDVTAIAKGDIISIDIDQIGSTVAGADLSVTIVCEVA